MFAVFAQYGKGLPKFKSAHKYKSKAEKVSARIECAGFKASIFEVTKIMESAQHDTAPTSRPDSKDAGASN